MLCSCYTVKSKATEAEPEPPSDVIEAFTKYSGDGIHMSADQLQRFMEDQHGRDGDAVSVSDAERVMDQILPVNRKSLLSQDFLRFLMSTDLNPPIRSKVHQDMNAPLSHYYMYTGHNSYLTGNQLTSRCSTRPIIKALKRGVRVIELDLWPNSSKNDINVLHGRTLTRRVILMDCLKAIKEYAFVASSYPVIITLEDHLTPDLQDKLAQMLTETFGSALFYPEAENLEELPSLENLKHRILISTKLPKKFLDDDACIKDKSFKGNKSSSTPFYKQLIAIQAGKLKNGLKNTLKVKSDNVKRLSLAEQVHEKAAGNHGQDLVRFTQENILRIYPKGTRFTSSNYKPLLGWLYGAQMVAFNMQGYGRSLWLMHGMFRANGNCGYVKKPDILMRCGSNNEVFNPKAKLPLKMSLKVKIYMGVGWHSDFKKTHFYAKVGIAGASVDKIMKKTKTKMDNWTPVWDEEFTFPLAVPELAILRIEVHDYMRTKKNILAGQICLPVSELRPGFRAVPLCDRKGDQCASTRLLMRFEFM